MRPYEPELMTLVEDMNPYVEDDACPDYDVAVSRRYVDAPCHVYWRGQLIFWSG